MLVPMREEPGARLIRRLDVNLPQPEVHRDNKTLPSATMETNDPSLRMSTSRTMSRLGIRLRAPTLRPKRSKAMHLEPPEEMSPWLRILRRIPKPAPSDPAACILILRLHQPPRNRLPPKHPRPALTLNELVAAMLAREVKRPFSLVQD